MHEHEWLIAPDNIGVWCRCGETMTLAQMLNYVKQTAPKWTSVEKPPKKRGYYFVAYEYESAVIAHEGYYTGKNWHVINDGIVPDKVNVTRWMPLPSPPTDAEEDA